ncbi:mono/diheme cytochrome c family protein [Haloferula luteola]|uniref:Mono/diheme cytochrome c family protein n=1 Tax=Haloferula luteola TaxID=595692 RepID=A0A840V665_9BACT|nr:diheme cytochrome c-553 [Haloferula luteola]MBB5353515.1 mono/diheme cytochrome c family protein [Haloferula luteola]
MMTLKHTTLSILAALALGVVGWALLRGQSQVSPVSSTTSQTRLLHGEYLVKLGGCADCHTPKMMTPQGPADDPARRFAGHPSDIILQVPDADPSNPWGAATAGMTAWTGPWGVTFSANLTPDRETGIGSWSEEEFIQAFRTGRHRGVGRPILPPMPWQPLAEAKKEDLQAIYAYLMSLPAVRNAVPDPLPPATAAK